MIISKEKMPRLVAEFARLEKVIRKNLNKQSYGDGE